MVPPPNIGKKKNLYVLQPNFCLNLRVQHGHCLRRHTEKPPDGVGVALKCKADKLFHKIYIPDAQTFFEALCETSKIKLFFIQSSEIAKMQKCIPANIKTVPGTMKIHQLVTSSPGEIYYRNVSCYWKYNFPNVFVAPAILNLNCVTIAIWYRV